MGKEWLFIRLLNFSCEAFVLGLSIMVINFIIKYKEKTQLPLMLLYGPFITGDYRGSTILSVNNNISGKASNSIDTAASGSLSPSGEKTRCGDWVKVAFRACYNLDINNSTPNLYLL